MYDQRSVFDRSSTCEGFTGGVAQALLTVTLLLGSASLVATASGDPGAMAMVALTGVTVVLLGAALVRLSESVGTTGRSV